MTTDTYPTPPHGWLAELERVAHPPLGQAAIYDRLEALEGRRRD